MITRTAAPAASSVPGRPAAGRLRVAYVVGRYPAVSHTFILREVLALRERDVEVETISINKARPDDTLSAADRAEAARTFSILPPDLRLLAGAHAVAILTRPRAYARTIHAAWRLARPGLRGKLWESFYLAEAVVLWRHCRRLGIRHFHVHHLNQASDATMLAIELEGRDRAGLSRWSWSFTMHGPDEFSDQTLFRLREKARSATGIACISDFARSQVMALLDEREWDKLRIVHCGLVADDFPPPAERPARAELRVLYVGRMVPVKGQSVLLEACAALIAEGIHAARRVRRRGPDADGRRAASARARHRRVRRRRRRDRPGRDPRALRRRRRVRARRASPRACRSCSWRRWRWSCPS